MKVAWRVHALRISIAACLLVLLVVLQTSVFSFLPIYGVHPDLILVVVISLGYLRGPMQGLAIGAAGGLLADVLTGQLIGLGAVITACIGAISGLIGLRLVRERILVPVLLSAAGSALHLSLYAAGVWAFGNGLSVIRGVLAIVPPLTVYNGVVMLIMHPLLVMINRMFDRRLVVPRRSTASDERL